MSSTLVVVHPVIVVVGRPYRQVDINGHPAGVAERPSDVLRLCREHGYEEVDLDDPAQVTWQGGDSDTWS
ncbi:hypothetical protein [Streptacidiphilus monticola]|jgi:hypothetical protein|uniref:Uncharacterized protein n=1 Tax=Streptacidiphilus monticola TaxID=2161674 RepID=A0ABW1FXA2_9ACTN